MRDRWTQWRRRNLTEPADRLAALMVLLLVLGAPAVGYGSTGYSECVDAVCRTVAHPIPVWGYLLLAVGGLGAGALLFRYRGRALLIGFGVLVAASFVGSFGIGWELLPAGLVSLVAGVWPRTGLKRS